MVQFKVTASLLLAAAAIVPAVAYPVKAEDSVVTREENEIASSFARSFDLELVEREFDEELYEREPYPAFPKLNKMASNAGGGRKGLKGLKGIRELTDEELYGRAIRSSKSVSGSAPHYVRELTKDVLDREFDEELYGRARGGAKQIAAAKSSKGAREFNDDLLDRGFDEELYGRAGAKRIAKAGSLKRVAPALGGREFNGDLLEREFDEELYGRAGGRAIKLNGIRPIRKGIARS